MSSNTELQSFYFLARAKHAAAFAALTAIPVYLAAPVAVVAATNYCNENRRKVLEFARNMAQQPGQADLLRETGQAVVVADGKYTSGEFPSCTWGQLVVDEVLHAMHIDPTAAAYSVVRHACIRPFLHSLIVFGIIAAADTYGVTQRLITPYASPELNRTVVALASKTNATTTTASLNHMIELQRHVGYWWFPRLSPLFRLLSSTSAPSDKLGNAGNNDMLSSLFYKYSNRNAAVMDSIVLQVVWQTVEFLTLWSHRVLSTASDSQVQERYRTPTASIYKRVVLHAVRTAVLTGMIVLLSKITRWHPYSCGIISRVLSTMIVPIPK